MRFRLSTNVAFREIALKLLALETSCDETSAAVIEDGRILSNVVSSQVRLHAEYGGVVPELATREHLKNLPIVTRQALREAHTPAGELDAIAATRGPGLPGALLVGLKAAQSMAFVLDKPFLGIHHHEGHLYSAWIEQDASVTAPMPRMNMEDFEPAIALVVSGGHTLLVHVESPLKHTVLGSTLDDAAGECFDKTAKLLDLPYPGGPIMDRLAAGGNPNAFDFPRPLLHKPGFDFSFSGLKTAVRYLLRDNPEVAQSDQGLRDLCASIQNAIVEVLVGKTLQAAKKLKVRCISASGGVSANSHLRATLAQACQRRKIKLRMASGTLCADNAGMIGALAWLKLSLGAQTDPLDLEPKPGWEIPSATLKASTT